MTVYEYRTDMTASSGEVSGVTLDIPGGLLRDVFVQPNTATTVFKASLQDDKGEDRIKWSLGSDICDHNLAFPMAGKYTFSITNASPDDTFTVILAVQEGR